MIAATGFGGSRSSGLALGVSRTRGRGGGFPLQRSGFGVGTWSYHIAAVLLLLLRAGSQETFSLSEPLPALVAEALLPANSDPDTEPHETPAVAPGKEGSAVSLESDEEAEKPAGEGAPEPDADVEQGGPGDEMAEDAGAPRGGRADVRRSRR